MLNYKLLRNHAGIMITGDYETLRGLHETVHDVNERSPIIMNREGVFIGLAYDLRKAFEGQRAKLAPPKFYPEIGLRFGVEILWPVLLVQSRMLRKSLAFIDTDKRTQAHAYALEAVIESALKDDFGGELGAELIERWQGIDPAHPWPEEKLHGRGAYYCALKKAERKNQIAGVLASLHPMYPALYQSWIRAGATNLPSPETLDEWDDAKWPDPHW